MAHNQNTPEEAFAAMALHNNASYGIKAEVESSQDEPSAAQRTFNIVELRELILKSLPPKELLLAQRVSKDWKATINTSRKLQERLFFRPSSTRLLSHDGAPASKWLDIATQEEVEPSWNPLLVPIYNSLRRSEKATFYKRLPDQTWDRPEASWRRMLRSQPPTKGIVYIRCFTSCFGRYEPDEREVELEDEDITAFHLLQMVTKERGKTDPDAGRHAFAYINGLSRRM